MYLTILKDLSNIWSSGLNIISYRPPSWNLKLYVKLENKSEIAELPAGCTINEVVRRLVKLLWQREIIIEAIFCDSNMSYVVFGPKWVDISLLTSFCILAKRLISMITWQLQLNYGLPNALTTHTFNTKNNFIHWKSLM